VYKCDFGTGVGFFRVKKNNKKPLISIRKNLDWVRWCSEEYHTLKMYDEGGICHIKYHKIDENTWINDQTVILDLLLRTVVNVNNLGEKVHSGVVFSNNPYLVLISQWMSIWF